MKRAALSFSLAALLLLGLATLAWAKEYRLTGNPLVPGAAGVVNTDTDRNGNTKIHVDVRHLAKPHALSPPHDSYVVWVQPPGMPPQNVGELKVNDDLSGSFRTAVPYKTFDVFITPEDSPRVTAPTGPELLRATVEK
jgi:hypothetical protein